MSEKGDAFDRDRQLLGHDAPREATAADERQYTDFDLLYSAVARCKGCGAGLAYPLDTDEAMRLRSWFCSRLLLGAAEPELSVAHDRLEFSMWKVKSEGQPSANGASTRPPGTVLLHVPTYTCGRCKHSWSHPAGPISGHAPAGPCEKCGNTNGSDFSAVYSNDAPRPIESRFAPVVVKAEPKP